MAAKKILIVEDDKMLCTIFKMFLDEQGYEIAGFALNSDSALDFCKNNKPDVILMDIHLQGQTDGIETAKLIEKSFDVPIVYISSDTEITTIQKSIIRNTYGFLVKPIYRVNLVLAIEFAYAKHQFDKNLKN